MSIQRFQELLRVRKHVLNMGAEVEHRLAEAIDSLFNRDVREAHEVRAGDDVIDAMELDIEAECLRLLALGQPVASDLRFVLAVTRINTDLERIADMAGGIAKRVIALDTRDRAIAIPPQLKEMGECSLSMLHDALQGLADNDVQLCQLVREADDRVDALLKELFDWAHAEIRSDVSATANVIDMLTIGRKFERIADVATNIAEDVIFIAKGAVVRHSR